MELRFFKRRTQPRPYIVPTKAGVTFFFFIIAEILMSAIYSSASLQLTGFFLLGLYALAMTWTHAEIRRLYLESVTVSDGLAQGSVRLQAHLRSELELDRSGTSMRIRFRQGQQIWWLEAVLGPIQGKGQVQPIIEVPAPTARGHWVSDRVEIFSRSPFGLFRVWALPKEKVETWIYPRPHEGTWTTSRPSHQGLSHPRDGDEDFSQLHESNRVESPARVAARSARQDSLLLIKEFQSQKGNESLLSWDHLKGSFEDRLSQCSGSLLRPTDSLRIETPFYTGPAQTLPQRKTALRAWATAREAPR